MHSIRPVLFCLAIFLMLTPGSSAQPAPVRLGVVGLVHGHVNGFLNSALKRNDIQIVGIAEANTSVAEGYRNRYHLEPGLFYQKLEAMLDAQRPEAVVVYTSTWDHRAAVEACARRGIHVMMEKPLAVNLEHAQAIARAARDGKIHVLVNFETTWYPSNQAAWKMAHEDSFGEIRKMVAHDGHRGPKEIGVQPEFLAWLTDPVLDGGGALMDFGCYGANLMTWLMDNQRPLSVTAITQQIKPQIYPRVDDEATIILTYPRATGIIQASWNWPFDRKDLEVYGRTGSALTVRRDGVRLRVGDKPEEQLTAEPLASPADDPIRYLAAVVRGQIQPAGLSSLENNLIVAEILEAASRSAKSGQTVRLSAGGLH
ncbi:MAG TPA: Gfo/Idh/MocA family oxidoreductase [Blastocatellia bacterium]|nr:Gfo/Idh/MocA family oxidoreductase [Blastocatellia bacterium]